MLAQQRRGPETRKLQDLRRAEGAGGEDHLAARTRTDGAALLTISDAHRDAALHEHALGQRMGCHREIAASACALEVGARRAPAPPVPHGGLEIAGALLGGTVEIVVAGHADFLRGADEGLADLVRLDLVRHCGRASRAMELVRAARLRFGFLEIREDVLVAPAHIAELAPVVEVLSLAADIE